MHPKLKLAVALMAVPVAISLGACGDDSGNDEAQQGEQIGQEAQQKGEQEGQKWREKGEAIGEKYEQEYGG